MPESQTFTIDPKNTLGNIMKPQQPIQQQIPTMNQIGNQQIPKRLINKLLKQTEIKQNQRNPNQNPNQNHQVPKSSQFNNGKDIEKEDLIIKIINYQNSRRFGQHLKKDLKINHTREQLVKKSVSQLQAIMYRIRTYLNTRHMEGVFEQMVKTTASGYETLITSFGYDITGFSDLLQNNPAFWDAFEMWKLERKLPEIPPSLQLMYIVSSTTIVAHLHNKYDNLTKENRIDQNKQKKEKVQQIKKQKKQDKQQQKEKEKTILKVGAIV